MPPWIGPGPHDRDLDHQVVEVRGLQARQHRHLRARLDLEHADGVGALASCRRPRGLRRGMSCIVEAARRGMRRHRSSARRIAVSMPSASTSTLSSPSASRSSLSHWITVRSAIAAFSTGTSRVEQAARDHEAADVLRQVAREADQLAGERDQPRDHRVVGIEAALRARRSGSDLRGRPTRRATSASRSTCAQVEAERLADVAQRALRPVGDHRRGQRGALAAVLARRCTGSPPRAAGARSRRRCRAARCARCEMKRSNSMRHARRDRPR